MEFLAVAADIQECVRRSRGRGIIHLDEGRCHTGRPRESAPYRLWQCKREGAPLFPEILKGPILPLAGSDVLHAP